MAAPLGHNNPPEDADAEARKERGYDPLSARILYKCGSVLTDLLNTDRAKILLTRQKGGNYIARKILFFALQEERPFGESRDEIRYGHISQAELHAITGMDRGTIGKDVADVARWANRSPEFNAFIDTIRDALDAAVAMTDYEERTLYLAMEQKALDRITTARKKLEESEREQSARASKRVLDYVASLPISEDQRATIMRAFCKEPARA